MGGYSGSKTDDFNYEISLLAYPLTSWTFGRLKGLKEFTYSTDSKRQCKADLGFKKLPEVEDRDRKEKYDEDHGGRYGRNIMPEVVAVGHGL